MLIRRNCHIKNSHRVQLNRAKSNNFKKCQLLQKMKMKWNKKWEKWLPRKILSQINNQHLQNKSLRLIKLIKSQIFLNKMIRRDLSSKSQQLILLLNQPLPNKIKWPILNMTRPLVSKSSNGLKKLKRLHTLLVKQMMKVAKPTRSTHTWSPSLRIKSRHMNNLVKIRSLMSKKISSKRWRRLIKLSRRRGQLKLKRRPC